MHYSPLTQVNRENVAGLELAWEWDTGEGPLRGPRLPIPDNPVRPGSFENTPLVYDGVMYVSTSYNKVVALNPDTGEVLWTYDPRITEWGQVPNGTGFVHRGVALWENEAGDRRVFLNSRWRLISIDTVTGEPDPSFGDGGEIDLTAQLLWPINRLHYTQTSPPVVFEDLVIMGNGVWDRFVYERDPPGNVQAFSTRTGELVWSFNLIPQPGEFGNDTWEDGAWDRVGHTNVWAPMSLDAERGLVYLPVGTPSNDYYGGTPPRRQPLRGGDRLPRRPHRRAGLALPDREARPLGLRPARRPDAVDHQRGRPGDRRGRGAREDRLRLCLRPGDRRAGLADRGPPGPAERRARRTGGRDPALPLEAGGVREAELHRGRRHRLHP